MDMQASAHPPGMAEDQGAGAATKRIMASVDGNQFTLIEKGSERLDAILELIGSAKKSVRLLFYMFNSDDAGRRVRDALIEAAARGVEVKVLLDGFGCGAADADFFDPIQENGGSYCRFHPSYGRRYLIRNHQKLAIADDQRAIIGGSNLHHSYLVDDGPKHWRDLWLVVEGPAVQPASRYFDALFKWTSSKRAKLRDLRKLIYRFSDDEGAVQWKFSGPATRHNPWPAAMVRDLRSAERFDMIAAYFSPPWAMLHRIRRLGSKARVITAAKSDNHATIAAARHTYSRMLRRGVQMFEYQPARLHTKLAIVDDAVHIGSSNFDFRSLYLNLEVMLRIKDAAFADAMRDYFEGEIADSEEITPRLHKERSTPWRRLKWAMSYFLVTSMDYTVTRQLNFGVER